MNRDQENFEQLRRLLALKRYEVPPPGYFENFPREVNSRLRAGERPSVGWFDRLSMDVPWLTRFWGAFESKPALAGVFGLVVCGVLVSAVVYSESSDAVAVPAFGQMESAPPTARLVDHSGLAASGLAAPVLPASAGLSPLGNGMGAVSPANPNPNSLFNLQRPEVQRVEFLAP